MKKTLCCLVFLFSIQLALPAFADIDLSALENDYNDMEQMVRDVRSDSVRDLSFIKQWQDTQLRVNKYDYQYVQCSLANSATRETMFGAWQKDSWFNYASTYRTRILVRGDMQANNYSAKFLPHSNGSSVTASYQSTSGVKNVSVDSPENTFLLSSATALSRVSLVNKEDPTNSSDLTYRHLSGRVDVTGRVLGDQLAAYRTVSSSGDVTSLKVTRVGADDINLQLNESRNSDDFTLALNGNSASRMIDGLWSSGIQRFSFVSSEERYALSSSDAQGTVSFTNKDDPSNGTDLTYRHVSGRVDVTGRLAGDQVTGYRTSSRNNLLTALRVTGAGADHLDFNLNELRNTDDFSLSMNGSRGSQMFNGYMYWLNGNRAALFNSSTGSVNYVRYQSSNSGYFRMIVPQDSTKSLFYTFNPSVDTAYGRYGNGTIRYVKYHYEDGVAEEQLLYRDIRNVDYLQYTETRQGNHSESQVVGSVQGFNIRGTSIQEGSASLRANNPIDGKTLAINLVDRRVSLDYKDQLNSLTMSLGQGLAAATYSGIVDGRNSMATLVKDANGIRLNAAINGWQAAFSSENRSLVITTSDGVIRSVGADRFLAVEHGHADALVSMLRDDLKLDLDFEKHFGSGGQDFVKFNDATSLLSADIAGHQIQWELTKRGSFQYNSPDGMIALKASNPSDGRIDLQTLRYNDSFMSVKLDNTYLAWMKGSSVLGLYDSKSYLIKMYLADSQQLEQSAKDVFDMVRQGDYKQVSAGKIIRDNVKEMKVNAREIVSSGALFFKEKRWNNLFSSLAWDVGEFSLSGSELAAVAEAKDHKEQLYIVLNHITPNGLQHEVMNKERSVFYQLGASLIDGSSATEGMGVTSLSQPAQVNFTSSKAMPFSGMEGISSGFNAGFVDISVPLIGSSSYTHLSLRGEAQRAFLWSDNEIMNTGSTGVHFTNLLYAYRFGPDTQISLEQGYRRQFSVQHQTRPLYNYDLRDAAGNNETGLQDLGYIVPGMMQGISLKDNDQRWHTDVTLMPFVPVTVNDQLNFGVGNGQGFAPTSIMNQLEYAVDMRGGVTMDVFQQKLALDAGKDVNNMMSLAPELTLAGKYKAGLSVTGAQLGSPETYRYHLGADALGLNSKFFMEQNVMSRTNSMGMSFDKKLGQNVYNFSTGVSAWDNAGVSQNVESYYSVGMNLNERCQLVNTLLIDQLTGSLGFQTSSSLNLFKKDISVGLDAGFTEASGTDLMFKAKSMF